MLEYLASQGVRVPPALEGVPAPAPIVKALDGLEFNNEVLLHLLMDVYELPCCPGENPIDWQQMFVKISQDLLPVIEPVAHGIVSAACPLADLAQECAAVQVTKHRESFTRKSTGPRWNAWRISQPFVGPIVPIHLMVQGI